jgi:hypothetical protein
MVKALVLYTDGRRQEEELSGLQDFQDRVGGDVESLASRTGRPYVDAQGGEHRLICYVNEEGMMRQLDPNPFAAVLALLGLQLSLNLFVYDNAVLMCEDPGTGDEADIAPEVVRLFTEVEALGPDDDEDEFFTLVERRQRRKKEAEKSPLVQAAKKPKKAQKPRK